MSEMDLLTKYLNEGTGRANRNPRLGSGTFAVTLEKFKKIAKKVKVSVMVAGAMTEGETEQVSAYVLSGRVDESTCPANPKGSKFDVYFRANGIDWKGENDKKDMVEIVIAVMRSIAPAEMKLDKTHYDAVTCNESFVKGVQVRVSTRPKKGKETDGAATTEAGEVFLYHNWSAVPGQTPDAKAARAATL